MSQYFQDWDIDNYDGFILKYNNCFSHSIHYWNYCKQWIILIDSLLYSGFCPLL